MKHLNKVFAGAAVLVLLTGCDLFKHSISAEKYQEKVDKLEAHQYSEATVTVKEVMNGTGYHAGTNIDQEDTGTFNWNSETNEWEAADEQTDPYLRFNIFCLQGKKVTDVITKPSSSTLEFKVTYYSNLEVKTVIKGSITMDEYSVTYDKYETNYKFDKYGYITSYKMVCNSSSTMGGESATQHNTRTYTVSYK